MVNEYSLRRYRVTSAEREPGKVKGVKRMPAVVPQFEPIKGKAKPMRPIVEHETQEVDYGVLHTDGPDPRDHSRDAEPDGRGRDREGSHRRPHRARGWSVEERDKILEMAKRGCTYKDIAEALGVTVDTARKRVYMYGIQHLHKIRKETKPRGNGYTAEQDEFIILAWNSGASAAQIGETIGRTEGSVKTRIMKLRDKGHELAYRRWKY